MRFLISILFLTPLYAHSLCSPDHAKIARCLEMKENILKKAVSEKSGPKNETSWIFVKDEKEALAFMKAFNNNDIAYNDDACISKLLLKECNNNSPASEHVKCDSAFETLHFFKGLILGMKTYGWPKETIKNGEHLIKTHVDQVMKSKPKLLEVQVTVSIAEYAQSLGFLQGNYRNLSSLKSQVEAFNEQHRSFYSNLKKPFTCDHGIAISKNEDELSNKYHKLLAESQRIE